MKLDFTLLADPRHEVGDLYGVRSSTNHPAARIYDHGFMQPAVFMHHAEREVYSWIQRPSMGNLWGLTGMKQPTAQQILEIARAATEG